MHHIRISPLPANLLQREIFSEGGAKDFNKHRQTDTGSRTRATPSITLEVREAVYHTPCPIYTSTCGLALVLDFLGWKGQKVQAASAEFGQGVEPRVVSSVTLVN